MMEKAVGIETAVRLQLYLIQDGGQLVVLTLWEQGRRPVVPKRLGRESRQY